MMNASPPDTQSRVTYVQTMLKAESTKTGIPAKKIFRPGRKAEGKTARAARAAIWRKMRRAGWTLESIAEAFGCSQDNVSRTLKGLI